MTWVEAFVLAAAGILGGVALSGIVRSVFVGSEAGPESTPRGVLVLLLLGGLALAGTVLINASQPVTTILLLAVVLLVGSASIAVLRRLGRSRSDSG